MSSHLKVCGIVLELGGRSYPVGLAFWWALGVLACDTNPPSTPWVQCTSGMASDCACQDGTLGVRRCNDRGVLGSCHCDAADQTQAATEGGESPSEPVEAGHQVVESESVDGGGMGLTVVEPARAGVSASSVAGGSVTSLGGLDEGGTVEQSSGGTPMDGGGFAPGPEFQCVAPNERCDDGERCCGLAQCIAGTCLAPPMASNGGASGYEEGSNQWGGSETPIGGMPFSGQMGGREESGGGLEMSMTEVGLGGLNMPTDALGGRAPAGSDEASVMPLRWDPDCREFAHCVSTCFTQECELACAANGTQEGILTYNEIVHCAQSRSCITAFGVVDRACLETHCEAEIATCFGPPSAPIAPNADCRDLTICLGGCHVLDPRCDTLCSENAPEEARVDLEAVETCRSERASVCAARDYYCLLTHCRTDEEKCFDPAPIPQGDLNCTDLESCLTNCNTNEDRVLCRGECMRSASPNAYNGYVSLMDCFDFYAGPIVECAVSSNGQASMCRRWACEAEYMICHRDRISPAGDGLSCEQTHLCIEGCGGDARCESRCFERTTHQDFGRYARLTFCRTHSQCSVADRQCLQTHCRFDYEACLGPVEVEPAPSNCASLQDCIRGCSPDNEACFADCRSQSSEGARALYDALSICGQTHGCDASNPGCFNEHCQVEQGACLGP